MSAAGTNLCTTPQTAPTRVPSAGAGDGWPAGVPIWLKGTPNWRVTVKPDSSVELQKALREAGGAKVKLSLIPGHDHFSLADQVFSGKQVYKWLFSHVQGAPMQQLSLLCTAQRKA